VVAALAVLTASNLSNEIAQVIVAQKICGVCSQRLSWRGC